MTRYVLVPRCHPESPVFCVVLFVFLLGLFCAAVVSPASLFNNHLLLCFPILKVPHLENRSASLTELLFAPAGFSFPQLMMSLLLVLQTAP